MPDTADTTPPKRGPGRPRKEPVAPAAAPEPAPAPEKKPVDPRIGLLHGDDTTTAVGFDDGAQYRVSEGVIVERLDR